MKASYGGIKTEYIIIGVIVLIAIWYFYSGSTTGTIQPNANAPSNSPGGIINQLQSDLLTSPGAAFLS